MSTDTTDPVPEAGPLPTDTEPTPPDTTEPPQPDTTEPPVTDTVAPPKPDIIAPPPDVVEPPKPDVVEPPEPDVVEPPEPDVVEPPEPVEITWTSHIQKIINSRCAPCHTSQSKGSLKIKNYGTMNDASPKCYANMTVAEAIAMKVQPSPGCKGQMPPSSKPQLTPEQVQQIVSWVDAGWPE